MSIELTEHDWDSHKAIIQSLYLTENRKLQGPDGVMQEMVRGYDFKATKAQFERHFRQWGFGKYNKKDTWVVIARQEAKRKRDEKETEVWTGHERVSEKKLKKELARYGYDAAFSYGSQAPSPKTPEGLYICTPAALQGDMSLLYNLPWFQFLDTIESRISPYPDLAAVAVSMANKSISNPARSKPQDLETVGYMSIIPDTVVPALSKCATTASTPTLSNTVRRIHHRLRAMIPEDFDREPNAGYKHTSGLIKMNGNVQHLSLAVFLLTNNMLDTEKVAVMAKRFQETSNVQLLRSLLSVGNPTVETLAEKLFLAAIQSEHQFIAQACLEAGADPNSRVLGRTALQHISGKANVEIAQVLLKAGANVNAPTVNPGGWTALQAAADSGNVKLVQVLLDAGAHVNAPAADSSGRTALQAAAGRGNIELVQILLSVGTDVNAPAAGSSGRTALQAAASRGNIELVQVLLNAKADVNAPPADSGGFTALQAAAESGSIKLVQILLSAGADVNAPAADYYGRTALQAAAGRGNIELVQVLLDAKADVNAPPADYYGRTALQAAAGRGNIELVQVLLGAKADLNASAAKYAGATSLQAAALSGHVRVATILLNAGADANADGALKNGRTALEGAAEHGRIDMVQLLLNAGVDLWGNEDVQYKRTLQLASVNGHNVVKRLVEAHYERSCTEHHR